MLEATLTALGVFAVMFLGLLGVEKLIHKITKNPDQSYKWGVWTFAVLAAVYTFLTSLGR